MIRRESRIGLMASGDVGKDAEKERITEGALPVFIQSKVPSFKEDESY
jgi:hypothetical protein